MKFMINAWLDKPKPELQLIDKLSGTVIAYWKDKRLLELFNCGAISYAELCSDEQEVQQELIKSLMLQITCEELCGQCVYQSS